MTSRCFDLNHRLGAELVGSALLAATVVGSGLMAERLAGGNVAIALLANSLATGAGLFAFITALGPVSGAHFNPAVSFAFAALGRLRWNHALASTGLLRAERAGTFILYRADFQELRKLTDYLWEDCCGGGKRCC